MRGGEKVLQEFGRLFPQAPILTLVARPDWLTDDLRKHRIQPSLIQRFPAAARRYPSLLPLFPTAVRNLSVPRETDFLLSSDASVIKGLKAEPGVPHVCFCHSPPRYLWDLQSTYLQKASKLGPLGRNVFRAAAPYVRNFDRRAADRVTAFIANSTFVRERIKAAYDRESTVIYPPVALDEFSPSERVEDFYLIVSEQTPYKRVDLAVRAFAKLGKPLVVIGDGPERAHLESIATPNIRFLGRQPDAVLKEHYQRCRALLFPGVEDFGITPLEAQASGRPVIAFGKGGVLETVVNGRTGIFFDSQTPEVLAETVAAFDAHWEIFDPQQCRANAARFGEQAFRAAITEYLTTNFPAYFPQARRTEAYAETLP